MKAPLWYVQGCECSECAYWRGRQEAAEAPERSERQGDTQPLPTSGTGTPVHELVKRDLDARLALGVRRYGQPLRAYNGRNALQDAYEEALDLACYLRQILEEQRLQADDGR